MRRAATIALSVIFALGARAAAQHPDKVSRVAFGSCANQNKPQPIWGPIVATAPQLFISIGDNIYGDTKDMKVLKEKYDLQAGVPGFQKLRQTCPLLATWDDHDYGANDAGSDYPLKEQSQQIFLDFFGVPADSPRRKQAGIYHAETFGPPGKRLQVILTDTRYFRSPLKRKKGFFPDGPYDVMSDPGTTVLGELQWQWLAQKLREPADVRLLVSSIQVVAADHHWEKWANFPHELSRLFQLLRDTKAGGVIVLSGDRHHAELSVMDAGIGYPLYDLTSSGLTEGDKNWRRLEVNRHRLATMNWGNNFGVVSIDWERPDPLLRLQIRDEAGEVTIQQKLPLSLLQPGAIKTKGAAAAVRIGDRVLTPALVAEHLKREVTLEMRVAATGASKELVFLNSSPERSSEDNFTIVLDRKAQESLRGAGIADPRRHYDGKAIRVVGVLSLFRERPQIIVSDAAKVQVLDK
jgi:alkaline phosphatase D